MMTSKQPKSQKIATEQPESQPTHRTINRA